jgi:hypothetical protein
MIHVSYVKRNNKQLFDSFSDINNNIIDIQNYCPLYNSLFEFNNSNWKNVVLNHKTYIKYIKNIDKTGTYHVVLNDNSQTNCFIKRIPIINPIYYLTGKYKDLSGIENCMSSLNKKGLIDKIDSIHNASYVDFFFYFLSSKLAELHSFEHACQYYDTFQCVHKHLDVNVTDEFDLLEQSKYFHENNGKIFSIHEELYADLFLNQSKKNKPQICVQNTLKSIQVDQIPNYIHDSFTSISRDESKHSLREVYSVDNKTDTVTDTDTDTDTGTDTDTDTCTDTDTYTDTNINDTNDTGYTDIDDTDTNTSEEYSENVSECDLTELSSEYIEEILVNIKVCTVQMICIEKMENTLDNYIENNTLSDMEWSSMLLQIIMILNTYQKVFDFTHNDLHTDNIMYKKTNKKQLTYRFNGVYYCVPTFGKIYKIIDFGRAIYKYKNIRYCSDSYHKKGDAASLYNCEPFYNPKKKKIEPNFSFDLCRLACSLYDHFLELRYDIYDNEIFRFIHSLCLDDNNIHMIYKNSKDMIIQKERYEGFLLYKKIARTVHNHTPDKVIQDRIFENFKITSYTHSIESPIMNIDALEPCFY